AGARAVVAAAAPPAAGARAVVVTPAPGTRAVVVVTPAPGTRAVVVTAPTSATATAVVGDRAGFHPHGIEIAVGRVVRPPVDREDDAPRPVAVVLAVVHGTKGDRHPLVPPPGLDRDGGRADPRVASVVHSHVEE